MIRIIGIDPGLAFLGIAVLDWDPKTDHASLVDVRVLTTKKSIRKEKILTSTDLTRRLEFLEDGFLHLLDHHAPTVAGFESISMPRNASTTAKIGMIWGACHALIRAREIPVYEFSPQEVRRGLNLRPGAGKQDIERVIVNRFSQYGDWPQTTKGSLLDHGVDAAAVALLTTHQRELRILKTLQ